eukprot:scaffold42254_cov17-Tisochrysis_lutea.AAC.1
MNLQGNRGTRKQSWSGGSGHQPKESKLRSKEGYKHENKCSKAQNTNRRGKLSAKAHLSCGSCLGDVPPVPIKLNLHENSHAGNSINGGKQGKQDINVALTKFPRE